MTTPARSRYAGHRFPAEIISHANQRRAIRRVAWIKEN
jgi:hypothetical protein